MDASQIVSSSIPTAECFELSDNWVLWAHLPHDTDWSLESYKNIMKISSIEEMIVLYRMLPEKMIKNCMLFLMRDGTTPMWEIKKIEKVGVSHIKFQIKMFFKFGN